MPPKRYFEQAAQDDDKDDQLPAPSKSSSSHSQSTLFVSRLPYSATSTDLSTLFSDVGPLKRAFIVTDPTTKTSKGVGYVAFALPQDAAKALEKLQGMSLDGGKRKMQIQWADEKAPLKERKALANSRLADAPKLQQVTSSNPPPPNKRQRVQASGHDQQEPREKSLAQVVEKDADAVRTVILSGLSASTSNVDSKSIYKRARKIGDVENVIYPHQRSPNPSDVAHVIFRTPNHAATAVEKLHAHTFKGVQISAILKKRADGAAKLAQHMRPETAAKRERMRSQVEKLSGKGSMPYLPPDIDRSSRLIIRNLPFDIAEADLRALFLPFGPIYSIDIPQKPKEAGPEQVTEQRESESDSLEAKSEDQIEAEEGVSSSESESEAESGSEAESEQITEEGSEDEADDQEQVASEEAEDAEIQGSTGSGTSHSGHNSTTAHSREEDVGGGDKNLSADDEGKGSDRAGQSKEGKGAGALGRGFAFVWHVSKSDAARALAGINGKAVRHGAAEHAAYKAAKGKKGRELAKAALDKVRQNALPERIVAVDWALSKKDWEQKADQSDAETDADMEDDASETEDDSQNGTDKEDEDDSEVDEKPKLPQPEEGTTLFIRNLPYQATEEELRDVFRHFGPLRYAKVTMDRSTGRSKGTGFVCFWQVASADAALRQAKLIEREAGVAGSSVKNAGGNPFSMPSVLTADPSAPLTASLNLHGRVLSVVPAVARDEASKLEESGKKQREKGDKRNTWLMREGVPFPNSQLSASLSQVECDKRLHSFTARRSQLASNPSLYISKTRLAIRQLPLFVTDRMLKRLALHAIRSFKAEVKLGKREDLTSDEKLDATISPAVENAKRKRGERPTSVVQSKIVRQNDRVDPLTGAGRSRGYGFLEMRTFADALRVIRWANANNAVAKLFTEWWSDDLKTMADRLKRTSSKPSEEITAEEKNENLARLRRIEKRIEELKSGGKVEKTERGGLIMIEFSIENATTTKKRNDRMTAQREGATRRKERAENPEVEQAAKEVARDLQRFDGSDTRETGEKHSNWNQKTKKASVSEQVSRARGARQIEKEKDLAKIGGTLHKGSIIGRKRKQRKQRSG
ncbi:hypothetical protein IE53DRAFT_388239 [Violaceomyces palustris]|uniref:Uncharacterized protein n=1 Tax=Violaceomyces palustris TaxID=1673888 RepID=A0ACD0NUP0_9BASI|nr:hypothetical protein IE53DRAFT_388239 [Violaceomyces palustris]